MRKWILRIVVCAVVLALFAAAAIQVVLWTDLPRQWVLGHLSTRLGIKISAGSFSTSWSGTTTVKDIALHLPIEQDAFLTVNQITLSHRALPLMLLTRSVEIASIELDRPVLNIEQDRTGHWNIQDVISRLDWPGKYTGAPQRIWPQCQIVDAMVVVTDSNGQAAKLGPLNFRGKHTNPTIWDFAANIPNTFKMHGQVGLGNTVAQQVDFEFEKMEDLLELWFSNVAEPARAAGHWRGQLRERNLTGWLKLDHLQLGTTVVEGDLKAELEPNAITLRPEKLTVEADVLPTKKITITGGSIQLSQKGVQAVQIVFDTGSLVGSVDGYWNLQTGEGAYAGSWTGTANGKRLRHEGNWQCSLNWPQVGPRQVLLKATMRGRSPWGNWNGAIEGTGSGSGWAASQWQISVPRISWDHRSKAVQIEDVTACFVVEGPKIRLTRLNVRNASHISARGEYSTDDERWSLRLDVEQLDMKELGRPPINLRLVASGDPNGATISDFQLSCKDARISVAGKLALPSTELQDMHASAQWRTQPQESTSAAPTYFAGEWHIDSDITGTIRPMNLALRCTLVGKKVTLRRKELPTFQVPLHASVTPKCVELESAEAFDLLGGTWYINGKCEFSERSNQVVEASAQEVSLRSIGELVGSPLPWQGLVTANLRLDLPSFDIYQSVGSGSWQARDIKIGYFEAASGQSDMTLRDGLVKFEPMLLTQGKGAVEGTMRFSLYKPQDIYLETVAKEWPVNLKKYDMQLITNASANCNLDVLKQSAQGTGNLSAELLLKGKSFGHVTLDSKVEGRTVELQKVDLAALGGNGQGSATIPMDDWLNSRVELKWQGVGLATVANWWPELGGFTGESSGALALRKADEPRPLEPLILEIKSELANGSFRDAHIGDCEVVAYAGKSRFIIDRLSLGVMKGEVNARAGLTQHNKKIFTRIHADFDQLDLNQLIHCFQPKAGKIAGRLAGKATVVTSSSLWPQAGELDIYLTESDLVNNSIVGALYDVLKLRFVQPRPVGHGWLKIRIEGSKARIISFRYFNRGIEFWGAGTIEDLDAGLASPVNGYVVALTRPLRAVSLPGINELDRLMTSLQTGAASIKVHGTLSKPETTTVSFLQISGELRRLLWSQLHK
jgi:hypothetical protein